MQVAQHEYGHSFSLLADEYSDPYPGFPACSDLTSPACEANVTNQTTRALIKWSPFILGSTPIPTPAGQTTVGLYQGARYLPTGMYRPKDFCAMRALGFAFCEVCKQAYVKRLYSGGWGTPSAGIRNIEPSSESPAPGTVPLTLPGSKTFSVQLLSPTTPSLSVTWLVNSVPQATGITTTSTATSFTYTPPSSGSYAVELRVKDATPLVDSTLQAAGQSSTRSWTLSATGGTCCRAGDASGDNNVDITDVVILAAEIVGNVVAGTAPFVAPLQTMNMNPGAGAAVDIVDIVILMSFIVGNTPSIPI